LANLQYNYFIICSQENSPI